MLISNVTGNFFLKQNDTATQIRLLITEVDGTPVDLSLAPRVEVVIGVNEGRVLVKTPIILSELGQLEFGLDEGDILPVGDDLLEVHVYTDAGEKRVAPSKGYYKLKVQKPIDELEVEVTTYTLDYFIGEVNRITQGLPELVVRAEDLADRLDVILVDSEAALEQSTTTLANANTALASATTAVNSATSAAQSATAAASAANTATSAALTAASSASTAAQAASSAATAANAGATSANTASTAANGAAQLATAAANSVDGLADDLLGYNISITDFSLATTYIKHQPARFNGSTFRAKVETTGNPLPVAPERENTWWTLVAQRGVDGTGSVGSVNGIQPDTDGNVDLGNLATDWASIAGKPTTFAPSAHRHDVSEIDNLPTTMNPNPHTHPISDIVDLQSTLDEINDSIADIGQTGIPKLATYQYVVPATANGQTEVAIPLDSFNAANDTVFLYRNRTAQEPTAYSVSNSVITLSEPVEDHTQTTFHIRILKNVPIGPEGSIDARVLLDGTLGLGKLTPELAAMINNSTSTTADVAGLNREVAYLKLKQEVSDRIEGGTVFADDFKGNRFGFTLDEVNSSGFKIKDGKLIMTEDVAQNFNVTDSTVAASAYLTAGNGGRKLIRLSNGWLIAGTMDFSTSPYPVGMYISKDNGITWSIFNKAAINLNVASGDIALATNADKVFLLRTLSNAQVWIFALDLDGNTTHSQAVDSSQNAIGNISLAIDPTNGHLYAAWASKNATYPNSFNIRYSKSTDGGTTWSTVEQVTMASQSHEGFSSLSIVVTDGTPLIVFSSIGYNINSGISQNTSRRGIYVIKRDTTLQTSSAINLSWTWGMLEENALSYSQLNPSTAVDKDGIIPVVWHGRDATHTTADYIRFSKSLDGAANWSTMKKVVPGINPTITVDRDNRYIITYSDGGIIKRIESIDKGDNWTVPINIANGTNPSSLYDPNFGLRFTVPPVIYMQGSTVKFTGNWTEQVEVPTAAATLTYNIPSTDYVGAYVQKTGNVTVTATLNGNAMESELETVEYRFEGSLASNVPVTLQLELSRPTTTGGENDALTRILGGRS